MFILLLFLKLLLSLSFILKKKLLERERNTVWCFIYAFITVRLSWSTLMSLFLWVVAVLEPAQYNLPLFSLQYGHWTPLPHQGHGSIFLWWFHRTYRITHTSYPIMGPLGGSVGYVADSILAQVSISWWWVEAPRWAPCRLGSPH